MRIDYLHNNEFSRQMNDVKKVVITKEGIRIVLKNKLEYYISSLSTKETDLEIIVQNDF